VSAAVLSVVGRGVELPTDTNVICQPPWALAGAEPVADDPALEVLDGSRVIEVTTLLGDSVLSVHQLHPRGGGVIRLSTWALLLVGAAAVPAGVLMAGACRTGEMGLLFLLATASLVLGALRARRQRRSPHFLVGPTPGADLSLDEPSLPGPRFTLVRRRPRGLSRAEARNNGLSRAGAGWDSGYELLFTAQTSGEVARGSRVTSLAELRRLGQAWPVSSQPGAWCWPIPCGGRAALRLGAVTLLIRSLAPPRRLPGRLAGGEERTMAPYIVGALLLHAPLLLAGLTSPIWWEGAAVWGEPRRLETIQALAVIRPPAAPLPPGAPVHGVAEQLPESEQGQVHAPSPGNPSFVRSPPISDRLDGLYGLRGPKDNPDPHLARRLSEAAAANMGVLALLGRDGSRSAVILADNLLGPLPDSRMPNIVGSAGPLPPPNVFAGRGEIRGALDREIIRRVIRRHINEVKYCYQKELSANPYLSGTILVKFTIGSAGLVTASGILRSTVGNTRVEQCIAHAIRRWRFPRPRGGGSVQVSYPFGFKSAGAL